ncbi:hypothetical protein EPVG_00307 [Emiliania huxleyi virus 201]|nr:hypothetical protein ELVG_00290 [Emiliania huxleyi virus 203]AEP15712.1 hypothetical protein EQVG_00302 [Emiliania huxleyi virus 207]AEP16154.1 hypothetical protein ERVG_00279 [Emiliania huxleyi virus 208]AET98194.1 hypothetical protein EPVG_00307 [Emiliania huxleyi virus 201]
MSITFLALLIVTWAVVIFSLSLLFVFGGGQVLVPETATEIDSAFNDSIGNTDEMDYVVSGLNPDDLDDLVAGLNPDDLDDLVAGVNQDDVNDVVSGINEDDLAYFIDDIGPDPVPGSIRPRGISKVDGRPSNFKRRRIMLN